MNLVTVLKYISAFFVVVIFSVVYREQNHAYELQRFRRSDCHIPMGIVFPIPSLEGLDTLNISGSSRPNKQGMIQSLGDIKMPLYVFDLFADHHYYINGLPEDWFGYARSSEIGLDADNVNIRDKLHRIIYGGKPHHTKTDSQTEQEMLKDLGFHYVFIDQERKTNPTAEHVDDFVQMVQSLPDPVWVHFHCSAGRNRTTIGMIMYDILKNGRKVSLDDIVLRHYLMGSENLFDTKIWRKGRYSQEMLDQRKKFITLFYSYVNSPDGLGFQSWQKWVESK